MRLIAIHEDDGDLVVKANLLRSSVDCDAAHHICHGIIKGINGLGHGHRRHGW